MNDQTDQQLLRAYAEVQSEAAFAAIVQRYVDLVYSAALRLSCDVHAAKDVTQNVFVALARNAPHLTARPALAGWLHGTARNLAVKAIRTDARRRAREQDAAVMNELLSTHADASWEHVAPHLDDALGELDDTDRDALLLRYFKNHDLRTVGATLGISDDAAQKRVSRAVERLREFFAKRGVTVGASGLVVVISANAVQAAPVGLALTISTFAALTGTTLATTATVTATRAIAITTLQKTIVAATIAVLAGAGIYEALLVSRLREQNQSFRLQQAPLTEQIQQLRTERDEATNRLLAMREDNERLNRNTDELLRLRGVVGSLRQQLIEFQTHEKNSSREVSRQLNTSTNLPVRSYSARALRKVAWNQTLVVGGWKTSSGNRTLVFATPRQANNATQLEIETRIYEMPENTPSQIGLNYFNGHEAPVPVDSDESHLTAIMPAEIYASIQAKLKHIEGVTELSVPNVTTLSGRFAEVQAVEDRQTPSGETYSIGPTINYMPNISSNGQTVDLGIVAQLYYPTSPSKP